MEIFWRVIRGQIDPRRRSYLYQQTWIWAYCLNYGCMMEWTWTKHKFINGTLWMADEFKHWNSKRRFYMFDNNIFPRTSFYRQWQVQEGGSIIGVLLIPTFQEFRYHSLSWMTSCTVTSFMHLVRRRAKLIWITLCILAAALLHWSGGFCRSLWTSWVFQIAVMIRLTLLIVHS